MSTPPDQFAKPRVAPSIFDAQGRMVHAWNLTPSNITDPVNLHLGPPYVLPVIFVPGIMGSNLRAKPSKDKPNAETGPVWRLDSKAGLGKLWAFREPGTRQRALRPDLTEVDDRGTVPSEAAGSVNGSKEYRQQLYHDRGWGEIGAASYQEFLLWLERTLNGNGWDPMAWKDYQLGETILRTAPKPGERPASYQPHTRMAVCGLPEGAAERSLHNLPLSFSDLQKRANYLMPVHACGYNWLDSNEAAAKLLATRIDEVLKKYGSRCKQVIVVTHSMGGLVTRRCQMLPGMSEKIAGVVHGVMPAVGAAVAYRRCKLGMADEGDWGAAQVIGATGRHITAVFAQAPGALQLLPSGDYPAGWLRLCDSQGKPAMRPLPTGNDPYTQIYLRRDRWWGLVREAWLAPQDGQAITWDVYEKNVAKTKEFHAAIRNQYHGTTYIYYGADDKHPSFTNITWHMRPGMAPDGRPSPNAAHVAELGMGEIRDDGSNPAYVGGATRWDSPAYIAGMAVTAPVRVDTSYWELHCDTQDGSGDGTVPHCSGRSPLNTDGCGQVQEQFHLTGFSHEGSYKSKDAQRVTLYAITRIAGLAGTKVPA